jgi:hypothetical protein
MAHMVVDDRPCGSWADSPMGFPFGPARNLEAAVRLFVLYPAWLLLAVVWLVPGIILSVRLQLRLWWTIPLVAVLVEGAWSGISHWPPNRWWPTIITGQIPMPSGFLFSYPVEAWDGYLYSLRAGCIDAFVAALSLLIVHRLRPNSALKAMHHE